MVTISFGAGYGNSIKLTSLDILILKYIERRNIILSEEDIRKYLNRDGKNRKSIHNKLKGLSLVGMGLIDTQKCVNKNVLCYGLTYDGRRVLFALDIKKKYKNIDHLPIGTFSGDKNNSINYTNEIKKFIRNKAIELKINVNDFKKLRKDYIDYNGKQKTMIFVYIKNLDNEKKSTKKL